VSQAAQELRALAKKIEELCQASRCYSVAWPAVRNCADHLTAIAALHENHERCSDDDHDT
jgi:hypothetical protein